jgi:hypothetical protein
VSVLQNEGVLPLGEFITGFPEATFVNIDQ